MAHQYHQERSIEWVRDWESAQAHKPVAERESFRVKHYGDFKRGISLIEVTHLDGDTTTHEVW